MFAHLPFAFAVQLHAGAVHQQVHRFAVVHGGQLHRELLRSAAQRRVVGYRQLGECELAQATREALEGPQRQMEDLLEPKQHLNRCVRVDVRPPPPGRCALGRRAQYAFVNPHRHVASRNQASVVARPVPDTIDTFRLASLVFVLAHLLGKKSRIYASPRKVNRRATLAVARKRQLAQPDLCNNATLI